MCSMCTNAMKTSLNDRSIFNEFNLPLSNISTNIEVQNFQRKFQFKLLHQSHHNSQNNSSLEIIPLSRFKKQTTWIHRHHRQTVLSRRNQLLSVSWILVALPFCLLLLLLLFFQRQILRIALRLHFQSQCWSLNVINFDPYIHTYIRIETSHENVSFLGFTVTISSSIVIQSNYPCCFVLIIPNGYLLFLFHFYFSVF